MYYVYLIKSLKNPSQTYIGYTSNLKHKLESHSLGECIETSDYKPWKLVTHIIFNSEKKAQEFEKYLNGSSGTVFAKKYLW